MCRIDEETLGILEEMEQPSSVSDNKSRLGGAASGGGGPEASDPIDGKNSMRMIRNFVHNESESE